MAFYSWYHGKIQNIFQTDFQKSFFEGDLSESGDDDHDNIQMLNMIAERQYTYRGNLENKSKR